MLFFFFFFFNIYWLPWVSAAACRLFSCGTQAESLHSIWNLVSLTRD